MKAVMYTNTVPKLAPPDFMRRYCCVLGIAFDVVDMEQALERVSLAMCTGTRLVLSTPNVNISVAAHADAAYRDLINSSDLVVMDGMPLVWMARLLGIRARRVAGSDLFDRLTRADPAELRVLFFGGPPGVAQKACDALNAQCRRSKAVGGISPGFGSATKMASDEVAAAINDRAPTFVVAALGAEKGHQWIGCIQEKIGSPVISHLGAVVNFVAGTVTRAPRFVQLAGLEWVWRIYQEPTLWRRYYGDAQALTVLSVKHILPLLCRKVLPRLSKVPAPELEARYCESLYDLTLRGGWTERDSARLGALLNDVVRRGLGVRIDLSQASEVDQSIIALLIRLEAYQRRIGLPCVISGAAASVKKSFIYCGADFVLG